MIVVCFRSPIIPLQLPHHNLNLLTVGCMVLPVSGSTASFRNIMCLKKCLIHRLTDEGNVRIGLKTLLCQIPSD